ncbi:hypothetical protein F5Y05DRAFT_413500 [Hypoxylon sp. FL0543]|nr:hypothetical protein F5Y05DRAFT_413500 [Hypoxylon sp. FL0543]
MRPMKIVEGDDRHHHNHGIETRKELLVFTVGTIILLGTSFMVYTLGFPPLAGFPSERFTTSRNLRNSFHSLFDA